MLDVVAVFEELSENSLPEFELIIDYWTVFTMVAKRTPVQDVQL